ncbi:hypothetical protein IGI04_002216 [Brassica rapa subsp. trilocularis]|uniref:DUF4005 domain-containing protein n=1 Tax=Brassica rapa subsp. trilocularis TaxID=1813537 RepID=A0ABQ7NUW8_BRACM|nr:hypothetical protein IGI04_002216 [Brassica rapa subsp. trilocularis]
MLSQENVATYVPEIKLRSNSIQIKHKPSDRFEYDDKNTDEPSSVITQLPHMHAVRSLRSDRARAKLGRYVATERAFCSVATERPSSYETSIQHYHRSNFAVKTAESSFLIERSRNKCFESEDGPKGPKT